MSRSSTPEATIKASDASTISTSTIPASDVDKRDRRVLEKILKGARAKTLPPVSPARRSLPSPQGGTILPAPNAIKPLPRPQDVKTVKDTSPSARAVRVEVHSYVRNQTVDLALFGDVSHELDKIESEVRKQKLNDRALDVAREHLHRVEETTKSLDEINKRVSEIMSEFSQGLGKEPVEGTNAADHIKLLSEMDRFKIADASKEKVTSMMGNYEKKAVDRGRLLEALQDWFQIMNNFSESIIEEEEHAASQLRLELATPMGRASKLGPSTVDEILSNAAAFESLIVTAKSTKGRLQDLHKGIMDMCYGYLYSKDKNMDEEAFKELQRKLQLANSMIERQNIDLREKSRRLNEAEARNMIMSKALEKKRNDIAESQYRENSELERLRRELSLASKMGQDQDGFGRRDSEAQRAYNRRASTIEQLSSIKKRDSSPYLSANLANSPSWRSSLGNLDESSKKIGELEDIIDDLEEKLQTSAQDFARKSAEYDIQIVSLRSQLVAAERNMRKQRIFQQRTMEETSRTYIEKQRAAIEQYYIYEKDQVRKDYQALLDEKDTIIKDLQEKLQKYEGGHMGDFVAAIMGQTKSKGNPPLLKEKQKSSKPLRDKNASSESESNAEKEAAKEKMKILERLRERDTNSKASKGSSKNLLEHTQASPAFNEEELRAQVKEELEAKYKIQLQKLKESYARKIAELQEESKKTASKAGDPKIVPSKFTKDLAKKTKLGVGKPSISLADFVAPTGGSEETQGVPSAIKTSVSNLSSGESADILQSRRQSSESHPSVSFMDLIEEAASDSDEIQKMNILLQKMDLEMLESKARYQKLEAQFSDLQKEYAEIIQKNQELEGMLHDVEGQLRSDLERRGIKSNTEEATADDDGRLDEETSSRGSREVGDVAEAKALAELYQRQMLVVKSGAMQFYQSLKDVFTDGLSLQALESWDDSAIQRMQIEELDTLENDDGKTLQDLLLLLQAILNNTQGVLMTNKRLSQSSPQQGRPPFAHHEDHQRHLDEVQKLERRIQALEQTNQQLETTFRSQIDQSSPEISMLQNHYDQQLHLSSVRIQELEGLLEAEKEASRQRIFDLQSRVDLLDAQLSKQNAQSPSRDLLHSKPASGVEGIAGPPKLSSILGWTSSRPSSSASGHLLTTVGSTERMDMLSESQLPKAIGISREPVVHSPKLLAFERAIQTDHIMVSASVSISEQSAGSFSHQDIGVSQQTSVSDLLAFNKREELMTREELEHAYRESGRLITMLRNRDIEIADKEKMILAMEDALHQNSALIRVLEGRLRDLHRLSEQSPVSVYTSITHDDSSASVAPPSPHWEHTNVLEKRLAEYESIISQLKELIKTTEPSRELARKLKTIRQNASLKKMHQELAAFPGGHAYGFSIPRSITDPSSPIDFITRDQYLRTAKVTATFKLLDLKSKIRRLQDEMKDSSDTDENNLLRKLLERNIGTMKRWEDRRNKMVAMRTRNLELILEGNGLMGDGGTNEERMQESLRL
eukprot:TRINITY_DN3642_c0_g1_i8.p1 TRINITY_DN3642_c0_g1~~TRINITY_DN3642_c0_g1_i8.p1  ORF type:complete len:1496 (+),score=388.25 TRINITY_DN3642_c0_g1_i8:124-4611(+)